MDHIPILFEHGGKKYSGYFSQVHGSGDGVWHLNDDKNFCCGRLRQANGKWVFDPTPKTGKLAEMANFFSDYLTYNSINYKQS